MNYDSNHFTPFYTHCLPWGLVSACGRPRYQWWGSGCHLIGHRGRKACPAEAAAACHHGCAS